MKTLVAAFFILSIISIAQAQVPPPEIDIPVINPGQRGASNARYCKNNPDAYWCFCPQSDPTEQRKCLIEHTGTRAPIGVPTHQRR